MNWSDFYNGFWEWSDATRRTRLSSLEDIGSGDEVVEVALEIEDPKVKAQLIRRAMKLGVAFDIENFMDLDGELPDALYEQLGEYTGFDLNDPYFDEDAMTWEDFYCSYSGWNEKLLLHRIKKLKQFGPSEEVSEAVQGMPNSVAERCLYTKAVAAGVSFTENEMLAMGNFAELIKKSSRGLDEPGAENVEDTVAEQNPKGPSRMGSENIVVDIQILNVEDHGANVLVDYTKVYGNGVKRVCRTHVKGLGGYYRLFSAKPIVTAVCIGKVYLGLIKNDVRILFVVRLKDGSAALIQVKEGSQASLKLLQLSQDTQNG